MATHQDKLIVLRFTSPFCQACKKLKQKFKDYLNQDPRFQDGGTVVLADLMVSNNKNVEDPFTDFVTSLGVTKIPFVQMNANGEAVDTFTCVEGCSWPKLKSKLLGFVDKYEGTLEKAAAAVEDSETVRVSAKAEEEDTPPLNNRNWLQRMIGN